MAACRGWRRQAGGALDGAGVDRYQAAVQITIGAAGDPSQSDEPQAVKVLFFFFSIQPVHRSTSEANVPDPAWFTI
jgi:hypothetical protein